MFKALLFCIIEDLIRNISGPLGVRLRRFWYARRLMYLGKSSVIDIGVRFIRPEYIEIGENCWIDNYVVIIAGPPNERGGNMRRKKNVDFDFEEGQVVIGDNCHIAMFVVIQGHGGVSIGADSGVASGCKIYSMSHHYRNDNDPTASIMYKFSPMADPAQQSLIVSPVVMKPGSAVGLNSVLLPGATVCEDGWLGTNSLLVKSVPAGKIYSGLPARFVSNR